MRRGLAAFAVFVWAMAACSARTPIAVPSTPLPDEATPSPTATPTKAKKKAPSARAVVSISGGALWLYDVAEDSVQRVSEDDAVRMPRWVTKDSFSFLKDGGGASALMLFNVRSGELQTLFRVSTGIAAYGWSPDRETVAYVTVDERDYPQIQYQSLVGEGATQTVATLARALGREATIDDQARVEFSKDGQRVLVVYTPADGDGGELTPDQTQLQVRTIDGTLAFAAEHADEPTMGLWAPDGTRLFFRTDGGARSWSAQNGRVSAVPHRPRWFNPSFSLDGKRVAFDTGGANRDVRVRILDLAKGSIADVSKRERFHPVWSNARTVWVQRVKPCRSDGCLLGSYEPVHEVFAIDLRSGEETKLALPSLVDADVLYL